MCILIIDDDAAVRASLGMMLEYEGYEIVGAASGSEGLTLAERKSPDLVLLDHDMPGMNGLEVLKRLHARRESLPVVMISAHLTASFMVEAIRTGAVECFEKPFENTGRLRTTIRGAIRQARLRDESPSDQTAGRV